VALPDGEFEVSGRGFPVVLSLIHDGRPAVSSLSPHVVASVLAEASPHLAADPPSAAGR
jgi:hypothetical protein